jgi:RNA polymerase sigma-70 factor (ECF subfamily)
MPDTSLSLLDRLRHRPDDGTWRRLVDVYTPLIRGWLRRHGLTEADADDLTQDVLAVLVRELPGFEHGGRPGAFRSWLRTITVNRARNFWRQRQAQPPARGGDAFLRVLGQLEDPDSAPSRLWYEEHDRHVARRLLALVEGDFEPTTWRAFRHVVLDGAKPAEAAAELGLSVNAVLFAKSRVLRRLRQEMSGLTG